jgi:hypothetical protein
MTVSFPDIFSECQKSIATHKKCMRSASQLLEKDPKSVEDFLSCVDRIIVVDKKHPSVERCISFIANFVTNHDSEGIADPLWYVHSSSTPYSLFSSTLTPTSKLIIILSSSVLGLHYSNISSPGPT